MRGARTERKGLWPLAQSPGDSDQRDHRIDRRMAKKRVHQIAKEKGIPSKEVLAKLQAAGFDVKAAASSVEEADIERAFDAGQPASATAEPGATEPAPAPAPSR